MSVELGGMGEGGGGGGSGTLEQGEVKCIELAAVSVQSAWHGTDKGWSVPLLSMPDRIARN